MLCGVVRFSLNRLPTPEDSIASFTKAVEIREIHFGDPAETEFSKAAYKNQDSFDRCCHSTFDLAFLKIKYGFLRLFKGEYSINNWPYFTLIYQFGDFR